ncbi:hypothetical protein FA15DRAFT_101726 [Coprinopsis marcescibilis]|uniref:F-box domain-containing protein n=1 Tax=Coprinopsis marcescibilis TaxID=230819 RepID=A0A5C3KL26_COPMA|nr:hypothetical protein FA15DRAFT_101726 [Coprinopsis marcescibilis]
MFPPIPEEITQLIIRYLPRRTLQKCLEVSQTFNRLATATMLKDDEILRAGGVHYIIDYQLSGTVGKRGPGDLENLLKSGYTDGANWNALHIHVKNINLSLSLNPDFHDPLRKVESLLNSFESVKDISLRFSPAQDCPDNVGLYLPVDYLVQAIGKVLNAAFSRCQRLSVFGLRSFFTRYYEFIGNDAFAFPKRRIWKEKLYTKSMAPLPSPIDHRYNRGALIPINYGLGVKIDRAPSFLHFVINDLQIIRPPFGNFILQRLARSGLRALTIKFSGYLPDHEELVFLLKRLRVSTPNVTHIFIDGDFDGRFAEDILLWLDSYPKLHQVDITGRADPYNHPRFSSPAKSNKLKAISFSRLHILQARPLLIQYLVGRCQSSLNPLQATGYKLLPKLGVVTVYPCFSRNAMLKHPDGNPPVALREGFFMVKDVLRSAGVDTDVGWRLRDDAELPLPEELAQNEK